MSQSISLPLATTRGAGRAHTTTDACVAPMCRHRSQRFTCISSLKGIAALGSRCPSHPPSAEACQGQAAGEGWGQSRPRARWATVGAVGHSGRLAPTSPGKGVPGIRCLQPREDGCGQGARRGRLPRASPARGSAVLSRNVLELPCATMGGESPGPAETPPVRAWPP